MEQVFFIQDWRHPGWRVVLQKEPRSRRVQDNDDEHILGISGDLSGLQLPVDMNAAEFRLDLMNAGEAVPAAEMATLNALVRVRDFRMANMRELPGKGEGEGDGELGGEGCPGGI